MSSRSPTRRRLVTGLATGFAVAVSGCAGIRDVEESSPGDGDHDPIENSPGEASGTDTEAGIPSPPENGSATSDGAGTGTETGTGTQVGNETGDADATATGTVVDENASN